MAIFKNEIKDNYTIIPNSLIECNLSNNAFRLLVYLYHKPSTWKIRQENIAREFKVSIRTVKSWVNELKNEGYLIINKRNVGQGFEYTYTLVHEVQNIAPDSAEYCTFKVQKTALHSNTEFSNTYIKEKINKKESFEKPSLEELKNYCLEKNLKNVDAEVFINFYESNGWMVGKNKMKNWKATISNWNKRDFNNSTKQKVIGNMDDWYKEEVKELSDQELKKLEEIRKLM